MSVINKSLTPQLLQSGFSAQAIHELADAEQTLSHFSIWNELQNTILDLSDQQVFDAQTKLSEESNIHVYLIQMLNLLANLENLKTEFESRGLLLSELIYDVWTKAEETRECFGVYGLHCYDFFIPFLSFDRVSIGRLEYENRIYRGSDITCGGLSVNEGQHVWGLHIPGGRALTKEACLDSFTRAFYYYGCTEERPLIMHCVSWLLNPEHKEMLSRPSNLLDFMDFFTPLESVVLDGFPDAWRLYGKAAAGMPETWPEDNRLRRAYKKLILAGGIPKRGAGIIVFDGNQVRTGRYSK